jgi:hypothetical protein
MKDKSDGSESSLPQRSLSLRQREEVQALLLTEGGRSPPRPSPTITDLYGKPKKRPEYPIGTVALYGPDDKATTKIAAGVITSPTAEPIVRRWVATDVTTNPMVQQEMKEFFAGHGVKSVAISEGNMGCPHQEGEDFLEGTDCPFCPFWAGKQGSNRRV